MSKAKSAAEKKEVEQKQAIHVSKGDAFFTQMREVTVAVKESAGTVAAICFDYEKNLALPITNTGQEYYKSQLWLHNFGVQDMATNQATMFVYSEHYTLVRD